MPITINNGNPIKGLQVKYGSSGQPIQAKKGYVNNEVLVYSADEAIFENGVLIGTKDNFTVRTQDDLGDGFANVNCLQLVAQASSFDSDNQYGWIQFDVTDFSSIYVEFIYAGWTRQADMNAWCGFNVPDAERETELEDLGSVHYYSESTVMSRTYDSSSLTGDKKFTARLLIGSTTGETTSVSYAKFIVRKIIGYV